MIEPERWKVSRLDVAFDFGKIKQAITVAVKERTVDMLDLFLEYIEGDIDSFMHEGLTYPSLMNEPLQAV